MSRIVALATLLVFVYNVKSTDANVSHFFQAARDKCVETFPAAEITNCYNWQDHSCNVTCVGYLKPNVDGSNSGIPFSEAMPKKDGTVCSSYYYTEDEEKHYCMKGICYSETDMKTCKAQEGINDYRNTYAIDSNGCKLRCGGDFVRETYKKEGTHCFYWDTYFIRGICDKAGNCVPRRTMVIDPAANQTHGIPKASVESANAICKLKGLKTKYASHQIAKLNNDDLCEFLCFYGEQSSREFETLTYTNGHDCSLNEEVKKCDGQGTCRSVAPSAIAG